MHQYCAQHDIDPTQDFYRMRDRGYQMTDAQLRIEMDRCGITQTQLAHLVGVEERSVRRWLAGERAVPADVANLILQLSIVTDWAADSARQRAADGATFFAYRSDRDFWEAMPGLAGNPASWWRMVLARADLTEVGYAEDGRVHPDYSARPTRVRWAGVDFVLSWDSQVSVGGGRVGGFPQAREVTLRVDVDQLYPGAPRYSEGAGMLHGASRDVLEGNLIVGWRLGHHAGRAWVNEPAQGEIEAVIEDLAARSNQDRIPERTWREAIEDAYCAYRDRTMGITRL